MKKESDTDLPAAFFGLLGLGAFIVGTFQSIHTTSILGVAMMLLASVWDGNLQRRNAAAEQTALLIEIRDLLKTKGETPGQG